MKLGAGWAIAAMLMTAGGCGGGGTDDDGGGVPLVSPGTSAPPPAAKSHIAGFWSGVLRVDGAEPRVLNLIALVAETGEFRWLAAEDVDQLFGESGEQLAGVIRGNADSFRSATDGAWFMPWGSENPDGTRWGDFMVSGFIYGDMVGNFESAWPDSEKRGGTFQLIYQRTLYEQASSLARLRGTYRTETESLSIDERGTIFYQSSDDGCTGNGTAKVIDQGFNMYRLQLTIGGCIGARAARNGLTFDGLGFIGANNEPGGGFLNSTLAFAISSSPDEFNGYYPIAWNLWADKE